MADFVKKNWQCDDVITADDLNRLEEGVEEALDCCGDKGYSCTEEWVTLTDESVTTAVSEGDPDAIGNFTYSELITSDTIKVTFNGTEYTCNKVVDVVNAYGAEWSDDTQNYDFSTYPFVIFSGTLGNELHTETAGAYQVKIEVFEETVEVSECFEKAVKSVSGGTPLIVNVVDSDPSVTPKSPNQSLKSSGVTESGYWLDKTWQEISDAFPNVFVNNPFDFAQEGVVNCKSSVTAVFTISIGENIYYIVRVVSPQSDDSFTTDSMDGYPIYD